MGWESGEPSPAAPSVLSSPADVTTSACSTSPAPSRPAWPSPKPSAGGATTSTKSSTAAPAGWPGQCRSTLPTAQPTPNIATYQPTFLYESLWDLGVAALVIWAEKRYRLGPGRAFALYVAAYTAGRGWVEALRVDHANHFLGLRLNDWTSLLVFAVSAGYLLLKRREPTPEPGNPDDPNAQPATPSEPGQGTDLS